MTYERSVGVSFSGFDDIEALMAEIGIEASFIGRKGELRNQNAKTTLGKNVVSYKWPISHDMRWDQAIKGLIHALGGLEKIQTIIAEFKPEFVHIDLVVPVRNSGEQEDNYIEPQTMAELVSLNASFGCSFV